MKRDKNKGNKFVGICSNILGVLVIITVAILCISGIVVTAKFTNQYYYEPNETINISLDCVLLNIIGIIVFLGFIYFFLKLSKKINEKWILLTILIIIAAMSIFWVNYVKAPSKVDQKGIFTIAFDFLDGNFIHLDKVNYLFLHPLQLGIVYFTMLVYKIINIENTLVFQNLNIVFVLISTLFLYKICKKIYNNEKTNRIFLILVPFFIVMPMISVLIYGNLVSLMFALISIYCVLKYFEGRKIFQLIIASLTLMFSVILKQNSLVFVIAICIIMFLDFIKTFKKANIIFIIVTIMITILSTPMIYKLTEAFTGKKVNDGIPMITYIAMGISENKNRSPGWYNDDFNVETVYIENNNDSVATSEYSKREIVNRLKFFIKNPSEFIEYYNEKIYSTWLEPTFQSLWFSSSMDETTDEIIEYYSNHKLIPSMLSGKISELIIKFLDIYQIIIYAFTVISIAISIKNKELNEKNIILILVFFGGFLFHILWETKSVYVIPYFYVLIPVAADGISKILDIINRKKSLGGIEETNG